MNSLAANIRNWIKKIGEWVKPNPDDGLLLQAVKMLYKALALLVLVALSPVIIVVLLFVFLAAI